MRFSGLYFNRKEDNAVVFDNVTSLYANASTTIDAQGAEFELQWKPINALEITGNYTFTERKGDDAIRIPKHKINTVLGYGFSGKTYASLSYAYTGPRLDTDFSTFENVALPTFSLVDLYVSHEIVPKKLKVFIEFSNLFNTKYTEILGFTTRGRNIRAGMNLTL